MLFHLIFILFLLLLAFQLAFCFFFRPLSREKSGNLDDIELPGVSVLICAKNEAGNLRRFLPAVLNQHYPKHLWELLIVNDASTDDSAHLLREWDQIYSQLRVITIPKDELRILPGKKFALDKGIAAAKFNTLLLTDADCKPASDQWLRLFAQKKATSGKAIILGYGTYFPQPGFLNQFIRWETRHTAIQYLSLARSGKPYMGVGRNLMYEKQLYDQAKKDIEFWEAYQQTPSGDDDLLISKIAAATNVSWCISEKAYTFSVPQNKWGNWRKQKTRHLSTGKLYNVKIRNLLGTYAFSQGLSWFFWILLLISGLVKYFRESSIDPILLWAILLGTIRLSAYWILSSGWNRTLKEGKLILFFPVGDFCWAIYNLIFAPYIFWKNKQEWK